MALNTTFALEKFNQQVMACQDEAFTLAISLVGSERLACQIIQEVIQKISTNETNTKHPVDMQVLRGVIFFTRQTNLSYSGEAVAIPGWNLLECQQKEVLLLVDVLGKTYQEAAYIVNSSCEELVKAIAMGRRSLALSLHAEKE